MPALLEPVVAPGSLAAREQPVLAADGLVLRPFVPADAPAIAEAYADPAIQRWHVETMTPDEAREWVDAQGVRWSQEARAGWAVTDGERLLGRIGLNRLNLFEGSAEAVYWVVPAARGRGVAPRALRTLTAWCFELGLHRVQLRHSTRNEASCRVARAAGYGLEGTMRGDGRHADGWHDMHLHARLADDHREQP